jgi:hypothetical protein
VILVVVNSLSIFPIRPSFREATYITPKDSGIVHAHLFPLPSQDLRRLAAVKLSPVVSEM